MFDIFHNIGGDVSSSVTGDLMPVDGTTKGTQRVLRRLLTNPGDYLWHLNYGAGLGKLVGSLASANTIKALIRSQIRLEAAVAQVPEPIVRVTPIANGVSVYLAYNDATTGAPQTLSFDINR